MANQVTILYHNTISILPTYPILTPGQPGRGWDGAFHSDVDQGDSKAFRRGPTFGDDATKVYAHSSGGCHKGNGQGNLCVAFSNINDEIKDCMKSYAQKEQSYHGGWFLWTTIQCRDGVSTGQTSMTL